jgi:hypothetical protein
VFVQEGAPIKVTFLVLKPGMSPLTTIQRSLEIMAIVGDDRRRNQHIAKKITEHPFAARLRTINTDNPKMFGTYLLHAWMKCCAGPLNEVDKASRRALAGTSCDHGRLPPKRDHG